MSFPIKVLSLFILPFGNTTIKFPQSITGCPLLTANFKRLTYLPPR